MLLTIVMIIPIHNATGANSYEGVIVLQNTTPTECEMMLSSIVPWNSTDVYYLLKCTDEKLDKYLLLWRSRVQPLDGYPVKIINEKRIQLRKDDDKYRWISNCTGEKDVGKGAIIALLPDDVEVANKGDLNVADGIWQESDDDLTPLSVDHVVYCM